MNSQQNLLTRKQVAATLGVCLPMVDKLIKAGRLPICRFGRAIRVRQTDLSRLTTPVPSIECRDGDRRFHLTQVEWDAIQKYGYRLGCTIKGMHLAEGDYLYGTSVRSLLDVLKRTRAFEIKSGGLPGTDENALASVFGSNARLDDFLSFLAGVRINDHDRPALLVAKTYAPAALMNV